MKKILLFILVSLSISVKSQTIEFLVSASPGGPNDTISRKVADILESKLDLQIIVLNKPGASHTIAYNYLQNTKKPTLIIETSMVENHKVYNNIDEIMKLGYFSLYVITASNSEIKDLYDIKNLSLNREILFAASGTTSFSYLGMQTMCNLGLRCVKIPYKSAAESILGIMANQVDLYSLVGFGSRGVLSNNKIRIVHKLDSKEKFYIKLFSKNIDENLIYEMKRILSVELNSTFYDDMNLKSEIN